MIFFMLQTEKLLRLLAHAGSCPARGGCQYPNCRKLKSLFHHGAQCKTRSSGGCRLCKKVWSFIQLHARVCKESQCNMPRCRYGPILFSSLCNNTITMHRHQHRRASCIVRSCAIKLNCDWEQGSERALEKAATDAMAV